MNDRIERLRAREKRRAMELRRATLAALKEQRVASLREQHLIRVKEILAGDYVLSRHRSRSEAA